MDTLMILSAKYLYLVVILLAVIYLFMQPRERQKKMVIFAIVSLPITYLFAKIAGHFYFDPRPFVTLHIKPLIDHAASNGFPSDHTLITVAIAVVLFPFSKKLGILTAVLALFVGISRIYVRVHSPIDIIGSFVIALPVGTIVYLVLKKYLFSRTA